MKFINCRQAILKKLQSWSCWSKNSQRPRQDFSGMSASATIGHQVPRIWVSEASSHPGAHKGMRESLSKWLQFSRIFNILLANIFQEVSADTLQNFVFLGENLFQKFQFILCCPKTQKNFPMKPIFDLENYVKKSRKLSQMSRNLWTHMKSLEPVQKIDWHLWRFTIYISTFNEYLTSGMENQEICIQAFEIFDTNFKTLWEFY